MQAQQPEQPGGRGTAGSGTTRRTRSAVGRAVADLERVEPAPGLPHSAARCASVTCGRAAARAATTPSASGSRRAAVDELVDGGRFGRRPGGAEAVGEQLAGLAGGQHVEGDAGSALGRDQADDLVPAGHQSEAARCARQQRAHLVGVARVVQHDEDPRAGEQAAVERGLPVEAGRDPGRHHEQRVQEAAHRGRPGRRDAPTGSYPRRFT
jgi:hypothetical protein